jgi:acyl-CoA synthetase (AMP-forming)/AMP-acid ligase II
VEVVLSGFPLFHLAGLMLGMVSLWAGGTQILIPDPRDTKHIIRELRKYRPSAMVNVPSLYMMLTREPCFKRVDFSRLKYALSGAAPFPPEAIRELERAIGRGKLMEVYGMTETSPLITANPLLNEGRIGSVGLPLPSTRVRLVDLETGSRDVPLGEEGELVVRGPQVMQGYWKKPEETAHALRELDGETWLYTGDVAVMDEQGFFYIVDRAKDMINVGGYKVFSREVEDKLHEHPAIERCAIVGVARPDRPGSELVRLVVERSASGKEQSESDVERDLLDFCRENLSPYKVPKIITFMDELPLTPVGKVDKKQLRTT